MLKLSVYGFATDSDVQEAIEARLSSITMSKRTDVGILLGEAVTALLEINDAIPVQAKQRHLVANALETFANG